MIEAIDIVRSRLKETIEERAYNFEDKSRRAIAKLLYSRLGNIPTCQAAAWGDEIADCAREILSL